MGDPLDKAQAELDSLERRLSQARAQSTIAPPPQQSHHSAYSVGMKMAVELAAGLGLGIIVGYACDTQFATKPLGVILGAIIGLVGGLWNVIRMSTGMNAAQPKSSDDTI